MNLLVAAFKLGDLVRDNETKKPGALDVIIGIIGGMDARKFKRFGYDRRVWYSHATVNAGRKLGSHSCEIYRSSGQSGGHLLPRITEGKGRWGEGTGYLDNNRQENRFKSDEESFNPINLKRKCAATA